MLCNMIERSFFLLGSVCYRMFGIDPRKAGFGANADPGNVCGARNAQFEQGFFDLSFGETMFAHH